MFFSEDSSGVSVVLLTVFLLSEVVLNSFKAYCLWTGHTLRFNGAKA